MNYPIVFVSIAALAMAACSGQSDVAEATADSAASAADVAAAEAPTEAAAPAAGEAPTREFMVGKWGEAGECELAFQFNADGSITDGPTDRWELNGAELTLVGLPQQMVLSVVDANTMESRLGGTEEPRRLTRC